MSGLPIQKKFAMRPRVDAKAQDAKLRDAAKMYEKQFLREMMKAMKSTIKHSEMSKPGYAENIYQNQLDNQYAEKWGDNGGIGLADLIYEQIKERYFNNKNLPKPSGPLPLKSPFNPISTPGSGKGLPIEVKPTEKDLGYIFRPSEMGLQGSEVTAPWSGQVSNVFGSHQHNFVEMTHDHGLTSLVGFSGELDSGLQTGMTIQEGQKLGLVKNVSQPLYWKIS